MLLLTVNKFALITIFLHLKVLTISCENRTVAFAIDDTLSMKPYIHQVRQGVKEIINIVLEKKSIQDYVLYTINAEDVVFRVKTTRKKSFLDNIDKISPRNNDNRGCEEKSLTGIEKALLASQHGSYILVYTDASAKDYNKVEDIKKLCQKRQSQVLFMLNGDCYNPSSKQYTVYHDIAAACSGQVIHLPKQGNDLGTKLFREFLTGSFVDKWRMLMKSSKFAPVSFTIDDMTNYALVAATGRDVQLRLSLTNKYNFFGREPDHKRVIWNKHSKAFKVFKPRTYNVLVKSQKSSSVVIYMQSNFTVSHGFSPYETDSIEYTSKQPLFGKQQHLFINVTDPSYLVDIQSAQLVDLKGVIIVPNLPLRKVGEKFYTTDKFVPPNIMFKIKVFGKVKTTKNSVSRISSITAFPTDSILDNIKLPPNVTVSEGDVVYVDYGGTVSLTCNVSSQSAPRIEWLTDEGILQVSEVYKLEEPLYFSYLKLENMRKNATYTCKAINEAGSTINKVNVTLRPVFNVISVPEEITIANYDEDVKLKCIVKSSVPVKVKWIWHGSELKNTAIHSISEDGTQLTLMSMDIGMDGTYTCETSLIDEPSVKRSFVTEVNITGILLPSIQSTYRIKNVNKGDNIKLECKIVEGKPKPQLQWFMKNDRNFVVLPHENKEVLLIPRASFENVGKYKCEAKNIMGAASKEFEVNIAPDISIVESDRMFPYGSNFEFTCKVESQGPVTILWTNEQGSILEGEIEKISHYESIKKLKLRNITVPAVYSCEATSDMGSATVYVNLNVSSPFIIREHIKNVTKIQHGSQHSLRCDIKSSLPIKINWYHYNSLTKSNKRLILIDSSDEQTISRDGTELIIKFMNLDMVGNYVCIASLVSDPMKSIAFSTTVQVDGIPPSIQTTKTKINKAKGDEIKLECIIVKAKPKPQVQWFKKNGRNFEVLPHENNEVLIIPRATFENVGKYKCEVKNNMGAASKEFDVNMNIAPDIYIIESDRMFPYDSNFEYTCKVESQAPVTILWMNQHGSILDGEMEKISDYESIKKLKLLNIREPAVYSCEATNDMGSATVYVSLNVSSPFIVREHIKNVTKIRYGSEQSLRCDIKSPLPITIQWYHFNPLTNSSEELKAIDSYNKQTVSRDGTELKIKFMDLDMVGNYVCIASLVSDPMKSIAFSTTVQVDGIPPSIQTTKTKINKAKGDEIKLECIIIKGKPKPQVQWFKKNGRNFEVLPHENNEVLIIPRATIENAGKYKCEVKNNMGAASKEFDVNMNIAPDIYIIESDRMFPYDSNFEYTCKVESQAPVTILWTNQHGSILDSETEKISDYESIQKLKLLNIREPAVYSCEATNDMGSATVYVSLNVSSPFIVREHIKNVTMIRYGSEQSLRCDIKSPLPITIQWYHFNPLTNSSKELKAIDSYNKQTVSRDGTELKIKFMDLDMVGNYVCTATLVSDPMKSIAFSTIVGVSGTRPKIKSTRSKTRVIKGNMIKLNCKIIGGQPKPQMRWFKRNGTTFVVLPKETNESLIISKTELKHSGQYKCEANNVIGNATAEFDVVVNGMPVITVDQTKITYTYGSDAVSTCKVESLTLPKIEWTDENGAILQDKVKQVSQYDFEVELKIQNIKKSGIYICATTNDVGSNSKIVNITVLSPFKISKHIDSITSVEYGTKKMLHCVITSSHPMTIKWYKENEEIVSNGSHSSAKQYISEDGTKLTINSMDLDMIGKYTCEASLKSDANESVSFSTVIEVSGFEPPVIKPTNKTLSVMKGEQIELPCKIIGGKPLPAIQWLKKNNGNYEQLSHKNEDVLLIPNAGHADAGQYKCEARNEKGTVLKEFDVSVSSAPEIKIIDKTRSFSYGSDAEFACKVESSPPPLSVVWTDHSGHILENKVRKITDYIFESKLKIESIEKSSIYKCTATNKVDTSSKIVNVTVLSPFVVPKNIDVVGTTNIPYYNAKTLHCNITSSHPMTIKWFRENEEIILSRKSDSSAKQYVSDDGTELTIKRMDLDMVGKYTCEASLKSDSNESVTFSTVVKISGLEPPVIEPTNKSVSVIKGEQIKLPCKIIGGKPLPAIQWLKKNNGNYEQLSHKNEDVLLIPNAGHADAGQYKCEARNEKGTVLKEFDVSVSSAPEIKIIDKTRSFSYGSDAEFACKVESSPPPLSVVWTDYSGHILENKVRKITDYIFESKLKIESIEKSSIYKCTATNKVDTSSKIVNVTVLSPFVVPKNIDVVGTTNIPYYNAKTLHCNITSSHPMTIKWFRENEEIILSRKSDSSAKQYVSDDGTELTIKRMDLDMVGKYTCEASLKSDSNESVTFSTVVKISGLEPPVIEPTNKSVSVIKGEQIKLPCKIIGGKPLPAIQWLKKNNGNYEQLSHKNEDVLLIPNAGHADAGQYKCEARNEKGTVLKEFDVSVSSAPEIKIIDKTRSFSYGSDAEFACKVESSPPPLSVVWTDHSGHILENKAYKITNYTFESKLKIENIEKSSIYICTATNKVDTSSESVNVTVLTPFVVPKNIDVVGTTNIPYYNAKTLHCNITSSHPMTIKWFRENEEIILSRKSDSSAKQYVSDDGTELTIARMDLDMVGKYTCEASLKSDSNECVTFSTVVKVSGLEPPVIEPTNKTLSLMKGEPIKLPCKIIRGKPLPVIQWLKKNNGNYEQLSHKNENVLLISKASYSDAGQYKCEAKNVNGTVFKEFDVSVNSAPEINIIETAKSFSYGSDAEFICKVESSPPPTSIVWTDDSGNIMANKVEKHSAYESSSLLKISYVQKSARYICTATNNVKSINKDVILNVRPVFKVREHIKDRTRIKYRSEKTLRCDITASYPMQIKWYINKIGFKTGRSLIHSSDTLKILSNATELKIMKMDLALVGKYTCEATLVANPKERIAYTTNVEIFGGEPPEITNDVTNYYGVIGDSMVIPCNVTGFPEPNINWVREDLSKLRDFKYTVKSNVLSITDLFKKTEEMSPIEFRCSARNEEGTASKKFTIFITDNFENDETYYGNSIDINAKIMEPVSIPCKIVDSNTLSIRWYLNGQLDTQTGKTYIIPIANVENEANYTCRVNTKEGTKSENYVLEVGFAPKFISEVISPKTVNWLEKNEELDCSVNAKPDEKIAWSHNGKILDRMNNLDKHQVTDWGDYTCTVSNVHGTVNRTFQVVSRGCYIKSDRDPLAPLMTDEIMSWPDTISNSGLVLNENEVIKLSCPSSVNSTNGFELFPSKTELIARCDTRDRLIIEGKNYLYKNLKCKIPIEAAVIRTSTECKGTNTEKIKVGFQFNEFLETYSVCYDTEKNLPVYAHVPETFKRGQGTDLQWNNVSNNTSMATDKCCYMKSQLVKAADLPFGPAQSSSFIEKLNDVPIWNPCNNNRTSWQELEEKIDASLYTDYYTQSSWTGASGYHTNKHGRFVPRYLWKVLQHDDDYSVMVYVNDASPEDTDIRCRQACHKFVKLEDKFTYCCSVEEFSDVFKISMESFVPENIIN